MEIKTIKNNSSELRKRWQRPLNRGDCLIKVSFIVHLTQVSLYVPFNSLTTYPDLPSKVPPLSSRQWNNWQTAHVENGFSTMVSNEHVRHAKPKNNSDHEQSFYFMETGHSNSYRKQERSLVTTPYKWGGVVHLVLKLTSWETKGRVDTPP